MPVYVQCPQCERKLGVPDNLLGKRVKCPSCQTVFTAEAPGEAPAPAAPPPREPERPAPAREPAAPRRREYEDEGEDDRPRQRSGNGGDREKALGLVRVPATCLLVHGILIILFSILTPILFLIGSAFANRSEKEAFYGWAIMSGCNGVLSLALAIFIVLGGLKMRSLQSYGLAMAGSIIAMLALPPCCCLVGIGIGIWSLVVLNNPEVKSAFR